MGQFVLNGAWNIFTHDTLCYLAHEPVVEMIHCMVDVFLDRDLPPVLEVVLDTPLS